MCKSERVYGRGTLLKEDTTRDHITFCIGSRRVSNNYPHTQ